MASKLDPLPESRSEYFEDADVNIHKIEEQKCDHYFIRNGREAVCEYCNMGFFLTSEVVKEGRIYKGKQLLI